MISAIYKTFIGLIAFFACASIALLIVNLPGLFFSGALLIALLLFCYGIGTLILEIRNE